MTLRNSRVAASLISAIDGVVPPARTARYVDYLAPGWHRVAVRGANEARIDLVLRDAAPIDAIVSDSSYGLPSEGTALARARTASTAVPSDDGDLTITTRRAKL